MDCLFFSGMIEQYSCIPKIFLVYVSGNKELSQGDPSLPMAIITISFYEYRDDLTGISLSSDSLFSS